jgi:hypothetical protein
MTLKTEKKLYNRKEKKRKEKRVWPRSMEI